MLKAVIFDLDGMTGVPFTVITADDGAKTKISGFDQPKFKQALGI